MKRSHEPVFWALFGAGGMLSALLAPVLVVVTGIALPLGWWWPPSAWNRGRVLVLLQSPAARLLLFAVIALFLFHAVHRLLHSLHDLGFRTGRAGPWVAYGSATVASVVTGGLLLRLGA